MASLLREMPAQVTSGRGSGGGISIGKCASKSKMVRDMLFSLDEALHCDKFYSGGRTKSRLGRIIGFCLSQKDEKKRLAGGEYH